MNVIDLLVGGPGGDRAACVDAEAGTLSRDDLRAAASRYAARLRAAGVPAGSRGLVVSDDSAAAVAAVLGLWWHGCVPVPVSPMLREPEILFMAKDSNAAVAHLAAPPAKQAVLRAELSSLVRVEDVELRGEPVDGPAPAEFAPADEVLVQYTSGSTGTPRGARHSRAGIDAVLAGFGSVLALTPDDVVVSTAKLSFGYGFGNGLLFPLAAGASVVLLGGAVDPYAVATALNTHHPTVLCSVPRMYAGLVQLADRGVPVSVDRLRTAVSAGEHLPDELAARFAEHFGTPLRNGLGATEVLHVVLADGRPVPGAAVTVRDDDGAPLPDGVQGRLHVAAASVALGYIDRPDATARTFADDGAYTGDIAVVEPGTGAVRHVCRADDLLNLGGYKMSPREIEAAVREAEGVADCAVVGETDENGLEQAVAYAVPVDGVDPEQARQAIVRAVRARLAPFKRPARVEVLDRLPVTSTGKLARFKLGEPR
ncbi:AMP-binding protein [Actinokineospora sp. G85]|uniref:AMP-binding protein n=1 Tax=Actinokineospora sp. G85 TaxID=3406626 RepID=UPI003C786310